MKPRLRRGLSYAGLALLALGGVCTVRALVSSPPARDLGAPVPGPAIDADVAARRLGAALAIPTISLPSGGTPAAFGELYATLATTYPRVHETLSVEEIGLSRVFRWEGTDPAAPGILLLAHVDVVPVEPGTEGSWTHPPFSGAVAEGQVWGRGALDDKMAVICLMETIDALLAQGFAPRRTIVLALGHDEEVGGTEGAANVAARLAESGARFSFVLDEGGVMLDGALPGIEVPIAFVGIAEKGYASFQLTLSAEGGHSSMPPPHGAVGRLGAAVARLEDAQMPTRLDGPTRRMLDTLAPHMSLPMRLGLSNLWLLGPAVAWGMSRDPAAAASVRTTTAPTIFTAGSADNVLASQARAVVNFRILPGDTVESVRAHIVDVVDDPDVSVQCIGICRDPSPSSPTDHEGFAAIARAIGQTFPDVVVTPYLVVGGTDARHYLGLSDAVYRFLPLSLRAEDRTMIHGTDEHIPVASLADAVAFYGRLLRIAAG